ncbi:molybdopterin oxidoreductase, partial [candidate division GN15 bacterium]
DLDNRRLSAVARDLIRARGKSLVIAGRCQPAPVHALVTLLNSALGNIGRTVTFVEPVDGIMPDRVMSQRLIEQMAAGSVDTLIMLGGNPVYDMPADWKFSEALSKVKHAVHLSSHADETSLACEWHLPEAHFLESWGDVRSVDGTASIVQPLIDPMFGGRSQIEVLSHLTTGEQKSGYELTRETWGKVWSPLTFEHNWGQALNKGVVGDSALPRLKPDVDGSTVGYLIRESASPSAEAGPA